VDKIVFLDRDGVINKCAKPHEYIAKWEDFEFIDHVPEAIKLLNDACYKVVVISNQRCVACGIATLEEVNALHEKLNEVLAKSGAHIDAFYICPHDIGTCKCRKPKIGLFLQAEQDFSVDKNRSYMIGDSESDIIAGQRYGIETIFIGDRIIGDFQCGSLYEATKNILKKDTVT